jgi:hypothetical protein
MKRLVIGIALLGWLGFLASSDVSAQGQIKDKVTYYKDRVKKVTAETIGEVTKEDSGGLKVQPLVGKSIDVPAGDVVDVVYDLRITGDSSLKWKSVYAGAVKAERDADKAAKADLRRKGLEEAMKGYQDILDSKLATKAANRHLEYKIARLTAVLATNNKGLEEKAVKLLGEFRDKNASCWQLNSCLERLADLQLQRDDYKGAVKTLDDMLQRKDLTDEAKMNYRMQIADALVKAKDYTGASTRLNDILKGMKDTDPRFFPLNMRRIKCKAADGGKVDEAITELVKIIKATKEEDKYRKAVAHNTLGDCYMLKDRVGDALYEFLLVDVWYPSDQQETAKAYGELIKIYEKLRKPARVKEYKDKLEKLKSGS